MKFWINLLTVISSYATLIGLIYTLKQPEASLSVFQIFLVVFFIVLCVIFVICEVYIFFSNKKPFYKSNYEIKEYLFSWISKGGRVAIFTRDMSWVDTQKMENLLLEKARNNELYICLPEMIDLTEKLKKEGARIFTYSELNYIPKSRFTIINKDRADSHVAIGRSKDNGIIVEEFAEGEHPSFSMANDLFEIIMKLGEKGSDK